MLDFRACLVCEAFLFSESLLCDFCGSEFTARIKRDGPAIRQRPFFTQSLWRWTDWNDGVSRALIYGLKGNEQPASWRRLASYMLGVFIPLPPESCFVPIPSKKGIPDHAFGLASALHELSGIPLVDLLRAPPQRSQRGLDKIERREIHFVKSRRLPRGCSNVILVDDCSSPLSRHIAAAQKALKRSDGVRAWCLMDRNLSVFP